MNPRSQFRFSLREMILVTLVVAAYFAGRIPGEHRANTAMQARVRYAETVALARQAEHAAKQTIKVLRQQLREADFARKTPTHPFPNLPSSSASSAQDFDNSEKAEATKKKRKQKKRGGMLTQEQLDAAFGAEKDVGPFWLLDDGTFYIPTEIGNFPE